MGIKQLGQFLHKKCPSVYTEINLKDYKFRKIAIDTSNYMYKYKAACGDRWLSAFINLVICLRKNNIHCVFVYDGKAPDEKTGEKKKRSRRRKDLKDSVKALEDSIKNFLENEVVDQKLIDICAKKAPKRLLSDDKSSIINLDVLYAELNKKKKQIITIKSDDFDKTKELFSIMKVPWIQAPGEAETLCSYLCVCGEVDAVLSEDTDVLAYGSPIFLNKMDTMKEKCLEAKYDNVLTGLEYTDKQFLDFCIMCGTDYNDNIPGIGPMNAYKLIKQYDSIDGIKEACEDTRIKLLMKCKNNFDILHYKKVREMFRDFDEFDYKVKYCGRPDMETLKQFLSDNGCYEVRIKRLEEAYKPNIIIEESSDEDIEIEVEVDSENEMTVQ